MQPANINRYAQQEGLLQACPAYVLPEKSCFSTCKVYYDTTCKQINGATTAVQAHRMPEVKV